MKNYEETADAVIKGIETCKNRKKQQRKILLHTATAVCCVLLAGATVFAVRQNRQPEEFLEDAMYPGIKDTFDISIGEDPDDPKANEKIIIHPVDSLHVGSMMGIAKHLDDFIEMDQLEMDRYYGFSFLPELPEDLQPRKGSYGIFRRDGGTGEIYWDQNQYTFSNENDSRWVCMTVAKEKLPFFDFRIPTKQLEYSVICNIEILLEQTPDGVYCAEFLHKNAGFYISAAGLSQEEFIAVITSVLQ